MALLLLLRTRTRNTDGNKLVIFSGIASYYGDYYICCNIPTSCCSEWITDGCVGVKVNESVVTCNCSHLTNFAILVVRIHFLIECTQLRWFSNIQWSLSNTDTLGTKTIVLISEVSLFQGENNMYLYSLNSVTCRD